MERTPKLPETPEAFVKKVDALLRLMMRNDMDDRDISSAAAIGNNIAAVRSTLDVLESSLLTGDEPISEEDEEVIKIEPVSIQLLVDEFRTFAFDDKLKIMGLLKEMPLEDIYPSLLNEFLLNMIHALESNVQIEHLYHLEAAKIEELVVADPSLAIAARYLDFLSKEENESLTAEEDEEATKLKADPKLEDALDELNERITVEVKNDLIERLTVIISKPSSGPIAEA